MIEVDTAVCDLCGACASVCPTAAICLSGNKVSVLRKDCTGCLKCLFVCPVDAISDSGK